MSMAPVSTMAGTDGYRNEPVDRTLRRWRGYAVGYDDDTLWTHYNIALTDVDIGGHLHVRWIEVCREELKHRGWL